MTTPVAHIENAILTRDHKDQPTWKIHIHTRNFKRLFVGIRHDTTTLCQCSFITNKFPNQLDLKKKTIFLVFLYM